MIEAQHFKVAIIGGGPAAIGTAVGPRLDPAHRLGAKSDDDHCTGVRPLHDSSRAPVYPCCLALRFIGVVEQSASVPLLEPLSMNL